MPLARDGEKNTLPETTGATTGEFSQQYGFQQINSTPLTAGGKAPDRKDINGVFNLLSGIAYYAQKGWTFHYDSTQDYYLGCVVIDPADGNRYECIADMAAGTVAPHEDTDGDYWRRYTLGDGEAVGVIKAFAGNGDIPAGYLLCDGAAVSRTMFPDLFAKIGTTYGAGDGSTTFNLPNLVGKFAEGAETAGTEKEAGLPNITGTFNIGIPANNGNANTAAIGSATGVFYASAPIGNNKPYWNPTGAVTSQNNGLANFNASRSSSIYGNSDTVQPNALTTRYIIKAFDGQTADSALIDITQYAQELAGKADRSLSNLTDAGKSFSFPSGTFIELNTALTRYEAPANGYVLAQMNTVTAMGYIILGNSANGMASTAYSSGTDNNGFSTWIPVKKGDTITIEKYNRSIILLRFVYAQGDVPV
jgi:microcystin-dependent protein